MFFYFIILWKDLAAQTYKGPMGSAESGSLPEGWVMNDNGGDGAIKSLPCAAVAAVEGRMKMRRSEGCRGGRRRAVRDPHKSADTVTAIAHRPPLSLSLSL